MSDQFTPRWGPVVGKPGYCGPSWISIVTGLSVEEIERQIIAYRNYKHRERTERFGRGVFRRSLRLHRVVGMNVMEALAIAKVNGVLPVEMKVEKREVETKHGTARLRPTFTQWLKQSVMWRGDDVYLVVTTSHFVLVKGDELADNNTRTPRHMKDWRSGRRSRVQRVYGLLKDDREAA